MESAARQSGRCLTLTDFDHRASLGRAGIVTGLVSKVSYDNLGVRPSAGVMLAFCCIQGNPMPRSVLDEASIHCAIRGEVESSQQAIVQEVKAAVAAHAVVVVGMGINPFVKKARKALDDAAVSYHYIEYGSYLSMWRERNALKMWTGWSTLPMVFVRGTLVGGATDLNKLIASGELKTLLAS